MNLKYLWHSFQENPMVVFIIGNILLGGMALGFMHSFTVDGGEVSVAQAVGAFFLASIFIRYMQYRVFYGENAEYIVRRLGNENLMLLSQLESASNLNEEWRKITNCKSPKSFAKVKTDTSSSKTRAKGKNKQTSVEVSALNKTVKAQSDEIRSLKNDIRSLKNEIGKSNTKFKELESKNRQLESALQLATDSLQKNEAEMDSQKRSLADLTEKTGVLENKLRASESENSRALKRNEELSAAVNDLEGKIKKISADLSAQCETLTEEVQALKFKLKLALQILADIAETTNSLAKWKLQVNELLSEEGAVHKILEECVNLVREVSKDPENIDNTEVDKLESEIHAKIDFYLSTVESLLKAA